MKKDNMKEDEAGLGVSPLIKSELQIKDGRAIASEVLEDLRRQSLSKAELEEYLAGKIKDSEAGANTYSEPNGD